MKTIIILVILATIFALSAHAGGYIPLDSSTQNTNYYTQAQVAAMTSASWNNPAPTSAIQVTDATSAFAALLHFCGISTSGIAIALLLLKAGAGYWRNFALKNAVASDVGPISRAVAHVAGSSLPETQSPTIQVQAPATSPWLQQPTNKGT